MPGKTLHSKTWRWMTLLSFVLSPLSAVETAAQDEPEYKMEVGVGGGMVNYLGDFNGNLLEGFEPVASLVGKYRMNPRMSVAMNVSYGQLEGSSAFSDSWYPTLSEAPAPLLFETNVIDAGLRYEYNFWAFGTGQEYRGARRVAPFLFAGLGVTIARAETDWRPMGGTETKKTATALSVPLGFGVKYKVTSRVNLAAEWAFHFTGSDELDGIRDPYGIVSSGAFKNTDCYGMMRLTLTYDIFAKCKTCHNDRD